MQQAIEASINKMS